MQDIINTAIQLGDLLKIDFSYGKKQHKRWIVRPLTVNETKMTAFCYNTEATRTFHLSKLTLHPFQPDYIEGRHDPGCKDFGWHFDQRIPALFRQGWLIRIDTEHAALYPRSTNDLVTRRDDFEQQHIHLMYIKSDHLPFHVWSQNAPDYRRYNNFSSAESYFIQRAAALRPDKSTDRR